MDTTLLKSAKLELSCSIAYHGVSYSASTSLTYHNAWVCAWGGVRELLDKAAGGVNSCFERAGRVIRVLKAGW